MITDSFEEYLRTQAGLTIEKRPSVLPPTSPPPLPPAPAHLQPGHKGDQKALLSLAEHHASTEGHKLGSWFPVDQGAASHCTNCGIEAVAHHSRAGGLFGGPALSSPCPGKLGHMASLAQRIDELTQTVQAGNPSIEIKTARRIARKAVAIQVKAELGDDYSMPDFTDPSHGDWTRAEGIGTHIPFTTPKHPLGRVPITDPQGAPAEGPSEHVGTDAAVGSLASRLAKARGLPAMLKGVGTEIGAAGAI